MSVKCAIPKPGDKFGTWTVLRFAEMRTWKEGQTMPFYHVKCCRNDCGVIDTLSRRALMYGAGCCRSCAQRRARPKL